jgi:hypothetical protein
MSSGCFDLILNRNIPGILKSHVKQPLISEFLNKERFDLASWYISDGPSRVVSDQKRH